MSTLILDFFRIVVFPTVINSTAYMHGTFSVLKNVKTNSWIQIIRKMSFQEILYLPTDRQTHKPTNTNRNKNTTSLVEIIAADYLVCTVVTFSSQYQLVQLTAQWNHICYAVHEAIGKYNILYIKRLHTHACNTQTLKANHIFTAITDKYSVYCCKHLCKPRFLKLLKNHMHNIHCGSKSQTCYVLNYFNKSSQYQ